MIVAMVVPDGARSMSRTLSCLDTAASGVFRVTGFFGATGGGAFKAGLVDRFGAGRDLRAVLRGGLRLLVGILVLLHA